MKRKKKNAVSKKRQARLFQTIVYNPQGIDLLSSSLKVFQQCTIQTYSIRECLRDMQSHVDDENRLSCGCGILHEPWRAVHFFLTVISKLKGLRNFHQTCQTVSHIPEAMLSPFILGDWQGGHPRQSKEDKQKHRSKKAMGTFGESQVSSINS